MYVLQAQVHDIHLPAMRIQIVLARMLERAQGDDELLPSAR
jgi:hypothetical protein